MSGNPKPTQDQFFYDPDRDHAIDKQALLSILENSSPKNLSWADYIRSIMAGASTIDAHAYTLARVTRVFFPEFYQKEFIDLHGNMAVVVIAMIFSILDYQETMAAIKKEVLEGSGDAYILKQLLLNKKMQNKNQEKKEEEKQKKQEEKELEDFEKKELKEFKDELEKIANNLFGTDILITLPGKNKPMTIAYKKEEKKPGNQKNKYLIAASEFLSNFWDLLTNYGFFYWLVWMTGMLIIDAALTPALAFGIPLAIISIFILGRIMDWAVARNKPGAAQIEETGINTKFNKLLIFIAYAEKLKFERLEKKVDKLIKDHLDFVLEKKYEEPHETGTEELTEDNNTKERTEEDLKNEEEVIKQTFFKNLFRRKAVVIGMFVLSALIGGYVITVFTEWPLTDLLVNVFHVSSVGGSFGLTSIAVFIVFGIGLTIGLFLAVKKGIEKNAEIEENARIFERYKETNREILKFKNSFERKINEINTRLKIQEKIVILKDKFYHGELLRLIEEIIPSHAKIAPESLFAKTRRYIATWVSGAGSGVFIIRSLLLTGCIIPLLAGPLSWATSFAAAMAVGVVWGLFKLAESIQKKEEARELEALKGSKNILSGLKQRHVLLDKVLLLIPTSKVPQQAAFVGVAASSGGLSPKHASVTPTHKKDKKDEESLTDGTTVKPKKDTKNG